MVFSKEIKKYIEIQKIVCYPINMKNLVKISSIIFEDEEVFIYLDEDTKFYTFFTLQNEKLKLVSKDKKEKLDAIYNISDGKVRNRTEDLKQEYKEVEDGFQNVIVDVFDKNNNPCQVFIKLSNEMMDYAWHIKNYLKKFTEKHIVNNIFGNCFDLKLLNDLTIQFDWNSLSDYFDFVTERIYFKDDCFYEEAFVHELLHYLTYKNSSIEGNLGFERFTKFNNQYHSSFQGINEGATDYYSYGDKESCYVECKYFYKILVKIIGEEKCKNYYATSNVEGLLKELSEKSMLSYRELSIVFSSLDVLNSTILTYRGCRVDKKTKEKFIVMFSNNFINFARLYFNFLLNNYPEKIIDVTFDNFLNQIDKSYIRTNQNFYNETTLRNRFENLKIQMLKNADKKLNLKLEQDIKF